MPRIDLQAWRTSASRATDARTARLSGHEVEVLGFLGLLPPALGGRLCRPYLRRLQTAPRSWDRTLRTLDGRHHRQRRWGGPRSARCP
ncbi:hypothetical protein [Amycolatopsis sp. cmx-8-4]|uniref:hypothetical protein n=1 Tax=Amycolatopsis sp. cmx-8-4 TaxID=2790947 RepID=UPI00397AB453